MTFAAAAAAAAAAADSSLSAFVALFAPPDIFNMADVAAVNGCSKNLCARRNRESRKIKTGEKKKKKTNWFENYS